MKAQLHSISLVHSVVLALLLALASVSSHAQIASTFGRVSETGTPSSGLAADYKRVSRFTVGTSGILWRICAYLDGKGGGTGRQSVRLVLYGDNNGVPGKQLFAGGEAEIEGGAAASWFCTQTPANYAYLPTALQPIAAGAYWIGIQTSGSASVIRDFAGGSGDWYGNKDTYADGASLSFGSGTRGNASLLVFADYYPNSVMRTAGRTTVGAYPSKGLAADFKRGSSFVMPERGELHGVAVLLDGLTSGPAGDGQNVRFAIYEDANGFPGDKVNETSIGGIAHGMPARWMFNETTISSIDPGRYWIALLSGPMGGTARDFTDGTAGNWYGNADSYSDGASAQFGPGVAGNGTLSAYVLYRPGVITQREVGSTNLPTTPSAGLRPDYFRGAICFGSGTLTGLHAYLDGLGGAAGSQTVRMVIYGYVLYGESFYPQLITQSDDVTIHAGMKPQWVDFKAPAVEIAGYDDILIIGIQSGPGAGVVRDYTDQRQLNYVWRGTPDAFADGPAAQLDDDHLTVGTWNLAVYATTSVNQE